MSEEIKKSTNRRDFLLATAICILVGAFGAFIVSLDTSGYVASMTFGILVFFCLFPIILILLILAIVAGIKNNAKFSIIFLMSCFLLSLSFVGSLKLMEVTKIAKYKQVSDEMRPIGSELNERIVIAFKENASQEELRKFDETILRKTIPQPNGILLEFADGVCGIMYPDTEFVYEIADVGFCDDASDEQKKTIKNGVNSSTIVYKVFENLRMEEIKNLPLDKKLETDASPKAGAPPTKIVIDKSSPVGK